MDRRLGLLCSALSVGLLPSVAVAQAPSVGAAATAPQVEAVVVTARKREENLQETPVAVTAVTDAVITQRNLTELRDIQNVAPNVLFTESQGFKGTARIFIRGVGENIQIFSADPAVGVYVDGIPLSRPQGANLNLLDVERVEVLRGPQGTTFGKNTIGGSINYVSKAPGDSFDAILKARLGNYDAFTLEGAADLPVNDTLSFRISGSRVKRDGFVKNHFDGGRLSDLDNFTLRGMARWEVNPDFDLLLSTDYFERNEKSNVAQMLSYNPAFFPLVTELDSAAFARYGLHPFALAVDGDPYRGFYSGGAAVLPGQPSIVATDPLRDRYKLDSKPNGTSQRIWGSYLIGTYDLDETFTVKSLTSYRRTLSNSLLDSWGGAIPINPNVLEENAEETSTELQLIGNDLLGGRGNFILGGFAGRTRADEVGTGWFEPELMATVLNFSTGRDQRQVTKSIAVFGNGDFDITEQLQLTVGARWTKDTKRMNRREFAAFPAGTDIGFGPALPPARPTPTGAPVVFNDTETWDAWSGVVSLQYQWTPDVMTYGGWSRGFRSGGFTGSARSASELAPFDPEFIDSYELGLRSTFLDRRVTFNATAFWMDYTDRQMQLVEVVSLSPFVSRVRIFNAGKSEQKGVEIEASVEPVSGLRIAGAYGYTDARYTELAGPFAGVGDVAVDLRRELPQTPKHTFNVAATYRTSLALPGELVFHADYNYRSKIYYDLPNSEAIAQGGYGLVNGRITWEAPSGGLEFAVWVRNLTNKTYRTDGTAVPGIFTSAYFGDPRTYGIEITKRFP